MSESDHPAYPLLSGVQSPADLKKLTEPQLRDLASEIRSFLLQTVSRTGGHLASNLGAVELTLALHTVFNSPKDQIVWDVGHQSYVHKLVTGRFQNFESLRQYGGLSGFPKPEENEHDIFGAGHSSTSISAAAGLAKARDLLGEDNKVIAVIGDGSMTGGMTFEALNHLGHLQTDLIIILNDNEMSISKNVGALSRYLTRLKMNPRLRKLKYEVQDLIQRIPKVGQATVRYLERLEDCLTYLVIPGMFFEELGISYLGPIDGHNISDLRLTLKNATERKGPVLIHTLTVKGKGYPLAERNPQKFHSTGPFVIETGNKVGDVIGLSYTDIFSTTITDLAKRDLRILTITAAMSGGTGLTRFSQEFPERFFDVGIAEEHAVTMAAGFAKKGFRPVVAVYSTFLQRAYDQIVHDVCLQNLPVIFMLDRAGLVGADGPTHHGVFDLTYLRHIPNLTLMAPKDETEFRDMIYSAFQMSGPVAIRYPKRDGVQLPENLNYRVLPEGKGEILLSGHNVALLAVGTMVKTAFSAALRLQKSGVYCTVVNARFVKPLDRDLLIQLARTHKHIVTLEENAIAGGFGSAVMEAYMDMGVSGLKFKLMGIPDHFVVHGPTGVLLSQCGLDEAGVCRIIKEMNLPAVGIRARL